MMVASRSDIKRRRRDSSPLDSNPKRTKVHAQRKFAQGVSSLSNLLSLTPVKEKDKLRNNGLGGNQVNGMNGSENAEGQSDVAIVGKRALPARGAKKPSIDDMITFLCYRGTSALPSHLAHLNKAPSPEPASQSQSGSSESRSKPGDKAGRERDKGNKKPLKSSASSAQKAVNAAQALKRKYQEQRIKKTSVSTIASKVKSTPLLRTTRSSAGAISKLPTRNVSNKIVEKKCENATPSKKKDSSTKDEAAKKSSVRTPVEKPSGSKPSTPVTSSGSRRGLRSSGIVSENVLRSGLRKLGSNVSIKKKKPVVTPPGEDGQQTKKLATSLSDFSSEDDQPLVKKPKPLIQVQKLIKKSIANIGRKMKMEPRRSKRGMSANPSPTSTSSSKRTPGLSKEQTPSTVISHLKEDDARVKSGKKTTSTSKELNGLVYKSSSQDSLKKDLMSSPKSTPVKMKKGYVMDLVHDSAEEDDVPVEARTRRGSRDLRDTADDKISTNQGTPEPSKKQGSISKKKDASKSTDQGKSLVGVNPTSNIVNTKSSSSVKNQVDLSLSSVLKSPPDLRIPPSIKRPLTSVGITNPMAIAAAAAVVHKTPTEKVKSKETLLPEDVKLSASSQSNSKNKPSKDEGKTGAAQSKLKPASDNKTFEKDQKPESTKTLTSTRKKDDTSEEDSTPTISNLMKDMKKSKVKTESSDSGKDNVRLESPKPARISRKSLVKEPSDDEETVVQLVKAVKNNAKDNDKTSLTSRARRSNIRSLKKVLNSDEEDSVEHAITQKQNLENAKIPPSGKKSMVTGNESQFDTSSKKHGTLQGNSQSLEGEVTKKQEESSENVESDSNSSDYSSAPVSKPSTRSSAKSKASISRSARSTRSGKKDSLDADSYGIKSKLKQKLDKDNMSSENESDSGRTGSSKAPKTRPKANRGLQKEAFSESTDDEGEKKSVLQQARRARRSATSTRSFRFRLRSSSSESNFSQDVDDDEDYFNDKVKKRLSADKLSKPSKLKHVRDSRSSKSKVLSDEDSDEDSKKTDDKRRRSRGKVADDTGRRSQSPRRSSRRGVKTHDKKSDLSEGSSSESSPSPNRRVLRERRFFSFAEVDPLSDSDEEVIAATKASLEMISQQKSPEPAEPASPAEPKKHRNSSAALSQDSDEDLSKSSEPVKGGKKSNTDPVQPKKILSKKRVKPPSEVQPNLNEELEKTLMSINLSPQMSKVLERSPDRSITSKSEDLPSMQSPNISVSCGLSNTVSVASEVSSLPPTTTLKPVKAVPKVSTITTSASSTLEKATDALSCGLQTSPAPQLPTVQSISSLPSTLNALAKRNLIHMKGLKQPAASASQVSVTSSASLVRTSLVPATMVPSSMVNSSMVPSSMMSTSMMSTNMMSTSMMPTNMMSSNMMPPGMVPTSMVPLSMVSSSTVPSSTVMSVMSSGQATASTLSASAPLVSQCPPMSGSIALPMSTAMPVSMPISLNNQLGISMQTAGGVNVPLSVPMSGTMTLPLQVGPLPSGSSGTTPFLLPVQSTLTPMLAPGQAIIKKETGGLGGMPNPVANASPLVVGMNPLVVNSNRTFFLSTGSTMTMTSSQQQMMPGPLMPSLLSLRLPDKPAGQQTIVASSPVYVPLFGNGGLIQTQGQVQPQIQTVAGMSTITAMASNIQNPVTNPVTANIQNTAAPNIQNTVTTNIHHALAANVQTAVTPHVQNVVASNMQNSTGVNVQGASSISSAMALAQNQATVGGTGMKRQLVLATTKGPVSKLILSVGEDGSHVLAAASPNTVTTSEGLMSVMQPSPSMKHPLPMVAQGRPACTIAPKISPVPSQPVQSLQSSTTVRPVVKQLTGQCSTVPVSSPGQVPVSNVMAGTRALSVTITGVPSSTTMQISKSGMTNVTSTGLSSSMITGSLSSLSTVPTMATKPCATQSFPVSSTAAHTAGAWSSSSASTACGGMNVHTTLASNSGKGDTSAHVKPETRPSNATALVRSTMPSVYSASTHQLQTSYPSTGVPATSISAMAKMVTAASVVTSSSRSAVSKPILPVTLAPSSTSSSPFKVSVAGSPVKITLSDLKTTTSVSVAPTPVLTSRIPSAPGALAALKSPSGTPTSSRAVAKTGSSRKSYSTAASYAAVKTTDTAAPVIITSSAAPSTFTSSPSDSPTSASSARMASVKPSVAGMKASSSPQPNKATTAQPGGGNSESKRKGCEVELASTHRTLSMLSTAFAGIGKDRKRDIATKKPTAVPETPTAVPEMPTAVEKKSKQLVTERSGLDSLAEIASTLAERSVETSAVDKRTPEHSLWANPAQILGRETLRVPGLPITANVGTNLPTKNELAKMKSGAVLADAVEKRSSYETEKLPKSKVSSSSTEKSSVAGLLTSSKADTPRQKVQKWLDDGSKGDLEHKRNCSLLSNGNSCTCDVMAEDISNLNSLADICVSMERINSPVKDTNTVKQGNKVTTDRRKKQDPVEPIKSSPQNSPAKPSPPLDSHQRKVAWQTAFGVKSPSRNAKHGYVVNTKQTGTSDEQKKNQVPACESSDKINQITSDTFGEDISKGSSDTNLDKTRTKKSESDAIGSINEEKKSAQKRSLLGRTAESSQAKLDSSAFSADNESSVYAFEAETDTLPISKPFRRRSKTLSRSDEEDSVSIGSTSNPVAVQVSKDPVFIPIQVEPDGSSAPLPELMLNKSKIRSPSPQHDNSDVYYIPIGGQEGNEGDARAVAVRLGKEGPNNRVVMSAKLVKKPPTFKHPNDSNEDGFPSKRAKVEVSPISPTAVQSVSSQQLNESEKSSNAQSHLEAKSNNQGSLIDSKIKQSKKEPSRSSALDSSSEDTSSLSHIPSSSKDFKESRSSMSPSSSRNRSPISDKTSPSANSKKKNQGRKRQSSIDSDASEKAQSRRVSKSKSSRMSPSPSLPSTSSTSSGPSRPSQKSNRSYNGPVPGNVSEAPVFHPTEKEFQDPYAYIEKIRPIAEKYGLCRIVAPRSFKPDCNVEDDIRFTADNQYVHKMMDRWGPNAKEMRAIVKYIAQHNIHLKHPPLVGGMELDLPRLYTTVQNFGGLMDVMDKKRWTKVAETMRIPKSAQDRASKLDEVYCKCLLPYETLKTSERDNLFEMVEVEWEMRKERRDKRLAATAIQSGSPGAVGATETESQTTSGGSQASSSAGTSVQPIARQEEEDDDEEEDEEDEEDECIVKGRSMPLTTFYRTARNTIHMWFKGSSPSATEVEHEFWRHVRDRNFHICVNSGSVDCSDPPYGFPIKNSPFAKHPWNLKVLSNSNGSILRSLGSVIGVTVPTLHFGMVFTTCCWYRDPHNLPWIEYLHTGAKKIWYGIPEHGGEKFRTAMQDVAPHYVRKKALWLASDTAMIPPNMLTERKVPLCRTVQEPGQFIVVFPRAHTSSVATGYIVSESVSFAPPSWIPTAVDSFKEMQNCNEPPLFSLDKLVFSIVEDQRTSPNVLNLILPAVMEILDREISGLRELKKMGVSTERIERSKKKSSGKKAKPLKEVEEMEVMECDVCSTNLYLSMLVNTEDDVGYCVPHGILCLEQKKMSASQCKLLHMYSQNELHGFCQTLLDRIEAKSGKKGSNFSSNNSDSGSCASTSTRN